jgi:hypothetical protein
MLANLIRLDCWIFRKDPPIVLCPKGGQAVLEAWVNIQDREEENLHDDDDNKNGFLLSILKFLFGRQRRYTKIGRFGFTTQRGPPAEPFSQTISEVYGITSGMQQYAGVAAIIYMFVESPYRRRELGTLALQGKCRLVVFSRRIFCLCVFHEQIE